MQPDYARRYRLLWEGHWWWRSRQAFLLAWVRRLHRRAPRRRILDVGCGDGLFFDALEAFGRVEGLEPDRSLLADPRWRSRIRTEALGDGFRGDGHYDLLLLLDVLEHIEDDGRALRAARSALRPGGHLLLTVPALGWLWSRHDVANAHFRRYAPGGLRFLLESSGFEVETIRFFFCWTVLPMLLRRWLAPAGGRGDPGGGGLDDGAEYRVAIPPPFWNQALEAWSRLEHAAGRFLRFPIGSSLLVIARRPAGPRRFDPATAPDSRRRPVALPRIRAKIEGPLPRPSTPDPSLVPGERSLHDPLRDFEPLPR